MTGNVSTMKTPHQLPPAPQHLDADRRELWNKVCAKYDFAGDALALRTLEELMGAYMRLSQIKAELRNTGPLIPTRDGNLKGNPLIALEARVQSQVLAHIRALGIKLDEDA